MILGIFKSNILSTLNKGILALFDIILKFTEYSAIIISIPAIKLSIFNLTCKNPVIDPAMAPPIAAATIVTIGLIPFTISAAEIAAPIGNVPSTDISGKSNILYVI